MPKLVITDDDGVREVPLQSGDTLGRVASNAIQLAVAEASRTHCRFTEEKGTWFLEDLGSSNGTLLNGRKTLKAELQDGDVIAVGNVSLRFLDVAVEPEIEDDDDGWDEDDELSLEDSHCLILMGAGRIGEVLTLPQGSVSVGRQSSHPVHLRDASVSGGHAVIEREGERCVLRDTGSSNGTFLNGRRVEESELEDGDEIHFGSVGAVYRKGPIDEIRGAAATVTMQTQGGDPGGDEEEWEEDHLQDLSAGRGERGWNLLALLLVLALAGAGVYLAVLREKPEAGTSRRTVRANDPWSFELPPESEEAAPERWVRRDALAPGSLRENFDLVRSGERSLEFTPEAGKAPVLASFHEAQSTSAGAVWDASVFATSLAPGARPVIQVTWSLRRPDGRTSLVERVCGAEPGEEWAEVKARFVAPDGADEAVFSVGAVGGGALVLDDAAFASAGGASGGVRSGDYLLTLGPAGTLSITRLGRLVLRLDGVVKEGTPPQDLAMIVTEAEGAARLGTLPGLGDLKVELGAGTPRVLKIEGPALAAATALRFSLPDTGEPGALALFNGEAGQRHVRAFDGESADAIAAGGRGDQVRIQLRDAQGQPSARSVRFEPTRDGGHFEVASAGAEALQLAFQLSFEEEEAEARRVIDLARREERETPGAALARLDAVIARFPDPRGAGLSARSLRDEILERGRKTLEADTASVEERLFFRDLLPAEAAADSLEAKAGRWAGSEMQAGFAALASQLREAVAATRAQGEEATAERLFQRARDYMDRKRWALARFLFAEVMRRFEDSDWAEQAENFVTALDAREDQKER